MKARMRKNSAGGTAPKNDNVPIAIPGKDVMDELKAPPHGFRKGGRVKAGGIAAGAKAMSNLGKAPRTGASMRGRSPYSSAGTLAPPKNGGGS